jgi:hypothetical protein
MKRVNRLVTLLAALTVLVGLLGSAQAQDELQDESNEEELSVEEWPAEESEQHAPAGDQPGPPSSQPGDGVIYLSDRPWISERNGWGPVERDQNNGEQALGDGQTISLGGTTFAKGLGVHAASDIRYNLAAACTTFAAVVGVDDQKGSDASVVFQIFAPQAVELAIPGVNELRLVVTDAGNSAAGDHASWGDARVTCSPSDVAFTQPTRSPGTPATAAPGSAQGPGQGSSQGPAQGQAVGPALAPTANCADSPGLEINPIPNGVRFEARGFTPGSLVMAWTIGPIRDGDRVQRPDRWYDTSFVANDSCRVVDSMVILPNSYGRHGIYLVGERLGGGPPLTMFQLMNMGPSVSSPGLAGTPAPATHDVPEAPGGIAARPVDRATIRIEWVDNSRNEQGFRIEVNSGRSGVHAVPSNISAYSVGGLRPDTDYCFTVKAFNGTAVSNGADICSRTPR